ncbi:MAG TPA: orotate phosphoribosyltransferase [Dehalococcoidia bacterium]|nr:orotate phosphoribosyltransferase [Dehalococcoidia bacterium]
MDKSDDRLLEVFKEHAVLRGDFTLTSGLKTSYYFDGRMVTLWPEGAYLIGKKILTIIMEAGAEAVGGMTMGADPIAAAVAVVSHLEGEPIPAFIVRSDVKGHGTQKRVEGPLKAGSKVAIVDDVITTGGSVLRAIDAVEAEGCRVVKVVVVLDRQQGGTEEIRRRGYDFAALLTADAEGEVRLA